MESSIKGGHGLKEPTQRVRRNTKPLLCSIYVTAAFHVRSNPRNIHYTLSPHTRGHQQNPLLYQNVLIFNCLSSVKAKCYLYWTVW